ncbi:MAG TPA: ABC transporter permease [Chloroflexota bacterium]|jgi:peptide/nickel transport system permease protein|nr:ABC transporter permease [Chloroflexota bacterium]
MEGVLRYLRRNPALIVGLVLLLVLLLFCAIGPFFVDTSNATSLSVPANRPPSLKYPLGTDRQGRDILAVMVAGTPLTLRIGFEAGLIGVSLGTILGFVSAYYGGLVDTIIKGIVDIGLTVPGLLVLVIIAVSLKQGLTVDEMALVVSVLSWLSPTRTIRSQVLTLRERAWVQVARLSGMSGPEVIVKELVPNLLPYLGASLVGAVSSAVLASIGLEALGLGPIESPTIGMTLYWVIYYGALLHGLWWWWMPPVVVLVILFVGLFSLSVGLDEIANPRLRRSV